MEGFGNITYRADTKAYVIGNNTYTVPHPEDESVPASVHAEFDELWYEIAEYAEANPDKVTEEQPAPPYEPTLEDLKGQKLTEINAAYDVAVSALVSSYPSNELLTFDKQESEARAWSADKSADTPLVDALALGRGMDKAELVSRILTKADAFAVATGYLTGLRQKYEDRLGQAHTAEEVAAIVPEYSLPDEGASV